VPPYGFLDILSGLADIPVRAPKRLGNDFVNKAIFKKGIRCNLHRSSSSFRFIGALPQYRRASLGADYRVCGELKHEESIANANSERSA